MMKKEFFYLLVILFAVALSSCSKDEIIVQEPEYPLDNGQWYQLEGSTEYHTGFIYKKGERNW